MIHLARHPVEPLTWWVLTSSRYRECNCKRDLALYYSDKLKELGLLSSIRLSDNNNYYSITRYNIMIAFKSDADEVEFILKYSEGIDGIEPYSNLYSDYNQYERIA